MNSFALILLSNGTFGGAQRRFTNLFIAFRKQFPEKAWFIVTPSMKKQIEQLYGPRALDGILAIGPEYDITEPIQNSAAESIHKTKRGGLLNLIKSSPLYQIYFYFKSRRVQFELFREVDALTKKYQIDRFLAIYTGVLPLYFYFSQKKRPRIVFVNMDSWFSHLSEQPQKHWYRQFDLFNRAHAEADMLDVLSPYILTGLQKRGIQFDTTRCSITACSFTDYSRCFVGDKVPFTIVFAARLEKDKNPLVFVDAAVKLAQEFPEARFVIAGEGRLANSIRTKLAESAASNVDYKGFEANLPNLLSTSSVFVSLQTDNNYPSQAVLEAMACGNAIIATDVGDTHMFVNEQNGWLIENGVEPLVEAMRHCLKNQQESHAKGDFAANFVRSNFTLERAMAYYKSILFPEHESTR